MASLRQVGWTAATPSVTAVPDSPGEQRQGTRAACAATRSTEAGRGTTGYYMARPARAESSFLPGRPPLGSERPSPARAASLIGSRAQGSRKSCVTLASRYAIRRLSPSSMEVRLCATDCRRGAGGGIAPLRFGMGHRPHPRAREPRRARSHLLRGPDNAGLRELDHEAKPALDARCIRWGVRRIFEAKLHDRGEDRRLLRATLPCGSAPPARRRSVKNSAENLSKAASTTAKRV